MRINKYLAAAGLGARRKCEDLVTAGRVTINDVVVRELGTQVQPTDKVAVDGKEVQVDGSFVYIMLNKPRGYITSARDERGRKTVFDLVPSDVRLFAVGRLDYETEGLLLLTNDGEFTRKITHPRSGVEKTYIVITDKPVTKSHLKILEAGVEIDGELTHPAKVQNDGAPNIFRLVITQGRNRQVRRMFAALGYEVMNLKRTAVGEFQLGDLATGKWKFIEA
ncbi:MAG: rRNA pseudouridine synthase [Firmicutes bacterium]|nr:rRNA pseudouridine synthase [Bacillota bacterium]